MMIKMKLWKRQRSSNRKHLLLSNFQEKIPSWRLVSLGLLLRQLPTETSWLRNLRKTRISECKSALRTKLSDMFFKELGLNSQMMNNFQRLTQKWSKFGIWTRLISTKLNLRSRRRMKLSLTAQQLIPRTLRQSLECRRICSNCCQKTSISWAQSNRSSSSTIFEIVYNYIKSWNWYLKIIRMLIIQFIIISYLSKFLNLILL